MEGHWKFTTGRGVIKAKILEAMYKADLEFPWGKGGGGGGCKNKTKNKKAFNEGSMDIF